MRYPIEIRKFAGVNQDLPPSELPMEIYSYVQNMRYKNLAMERMAGHAKVFASGMLEAPLHMIGIQQPLDYFWIYAGTTKIGVVDTTGAHTEITPLAGVNAASYTANWTSGQINGVPYLSHPNQDPLYWDGLTTSDMQVIPGWPANTKAAVVRTFNNFLIALDITEASINYQNRIKWSSSAAAGSIPNSWDATDPTNDSGQIELAGTQGRLIDCLPLYGDNIVYKDNSTFIMSYTRDQDVFAFRELFRETGLIAKNCVCQFHGKHLAFTLDDVIVHDGQTQISILDKRLRKTLFNAIDAANIKKSFVVPYYQKNEIWICFANGGTGANGLPNQALVWNYQDNQFGWRDLPEVAFITPGIISEFGGVLDWDPDTQAWDEDETIWNQNTIGIVTQNLMMASGANLYQMDITNQFDGVDYLSYAERTGLPLADNTTETKLIRALWPNIEGQTGTLLKIAVGTQMHPDDPIDWSPEGDFVIGTDDRFQVFAKGRFLSFRIASYSGPPWTVHGIAFEVKPVGRY